MAGPPHSTTPLYAGWRERYQLVGRLGSGGFAEVYEAHDLQLDERVALKIICNRRSMPRRVAREVEAAAALSHPGIVALYDWFGDGQRSILVWELVKGSPLTDLVGELGAGDVAAIGSELLRALAYAHQQGVVHRDIKPQNVMLNADGRVKVMDFGIARLIDADTLTQDGDVIGTVAYMSPEQAAGRRVGPPSDVYSAGIVLFELLAGVNPLRGQTPAETMANVAAGRLPPLAEVRPGLPSELCELVDDACSPRPAERPPAAELGAAFEDLVRSGRLRGLRLRRAARLVRPLARLSGVAERAGGAALAAVTAAGVTSALPAYPQSWMLPLAAISAAVWAVTPVTGLAWLLGVLAFPMFNVSFSAGAAYLVFAVGVFLLARGRPVVAVWPTLAVALMPLHLALLAPAAASVLLGRLRGVVAAAWAAVGTLLYLVLSGAPAGPFTFFQAPSAAGAEAAAAGNPVSLVLGLAGHVVAPTCMVQMGLWAVLAVAVDLAFMLSGLVSRLLVWFLSFAAVFCVYRLVPVVAWGYPVTPTPVILSVVLAAAVILLPLVLTAGKVREERRDGDLQES